MKKSLIFCVLLICYAGLAFTGCAKKSNTSSVSAVGDTLTLNLPDTFSYVSKCNYCESGDFWTYTYGNNGGFDASGFHFSHNSGFDIYSYWGGFIPAKGADTRCYTANCYAGDTCQCQAANPPCDSVDLQGSWGWIHNQWGVMAGYGLDAAYQRNKCAPYLVAYWDYYSDTQGQYSLEVTLDNDNLFQPLEVYICNHPWPFWGNRCGDGFARPLTEATDYFNLIITGYDIDELETGAITDTLARGTGSDVIQNINWHPVDLSNFEEYTYKLVFTMESTDEDPQYGPNTAVYFCMDKLKVVDKGAAPAALRAKAAAAAKPAVEVVDGMTLHSHKGGVVTVYDANGKEVLKATLKAGEDKLDLSKLPAGEYRVRHGHKSIPVKKTN